MRNPSMTRHGLVVAAKVVVWLSALFVFVLVLGPITERPWGGLLNTALVTLIACASYFGGVMDGRGPAIPSHLVSKRPYVVLYFVRLVLAAFAGILITMVVAAILTPPDPFSMLLCFVPLCVVFGALYFIGFRRNSMQSPRNARDSFTRPFQFILVLLLGFDALWMTISPLDDGTLSRAVGFLLLIAAVAVLFVFGPRRADAVDRGG